MQILSKIASKFLDFAIFVIAHYEDLLQHFHLISMLHSI